MTNQTTTVKTITKRDIVWMTGDLVVLTTEDGDEYCGRETWDALAQMYAEQAHAVRSLRSPRRSNLDRIGR